MRNALWVILPISTSIVGVVMVEFFVWGGEVVGYFMITINIKQKLKNVQSYDNIIICTYYTYYTVYHIIISRR